MLVKTCGAKCIGIEAVPVSVEVDISKGIGIHLVGLADTAVKESLLRIISAVESIGMRIPGKKIVINLAPADLQKSGTGYDLPIAIGIIASSMQADFPNVDKYLIMGELGLGASLRSVPGALPMVEMAIKMGMKACILPLESAIEASDYKGITVYGVKNLEDVVHILSEKEDTTEYVVKQFERMDSEPDSSDTHSEYMDFSEIIGQESAKRGLEIAAAGGHNVMMIGTPGCGKSSLAKAMLGILPTMCNEEAITTSKIYSVAGKSNRHSGLIRIRPFRAPHHSASMAAIIGGGHGSNIFPGELSLAHNGIFFADEFPQMPRSVSEALRAPLEDRKVVISRASTKIEFPASFMFIAAANPCPCGYYGEKNKCVCTQAQRATYISRLSGPIMDRIDIQLWMSPVNTKSLIKPPKSESSALIAKRVAKAREIQRQRFVSENIFTNSEMTNRHIKKYCVLSTESKSVLEKVMETSGLSARSFSRLLKLARTIADLAGEDNILPNHILEAVSYRFLDRAIL